MSLVQIIENSTKTLTGNLTEILKSQIYFLQEQNYFIKSVLQQKQIIIEKLLDINKNQIKNNYPGM